jgi:hypothetical protein
MESSQFRANSRVKWEASQKRRRHLHQRRPSCYIAYEGDLAEQFYTHQGTRLSPYRLPDDGPQCLELMIFLRHSENLSLTQISSITGQSAEAVKLRHLEFRNGCRNSLSAASHAPP